MNFTSQVDHLKAVLHDTALAKFPWLERLMSSVIDLLTGPLTGHDTRYYWVTMAETMVAVVILFLIYGGARYGVRGFLGFCFPRSVFLHASALVDYQVNIVSHFIGNFFEITWRLNTPLMTGLLLAGLVRVFGPGPQLFHWNTACLVAMTAIMAIGNDFGYYVFHYASHKVPFLWAFHKMHHSAEVLTPFTAGRVHPVEFVFSAPLRSAGEALALAPALYFFATQPSVLQIFGVSVALLVTGALGSQLLHSHIHLSWGPVFDRIIISPALHRIHHSSAPEHWDRNFGGRWAFFDWAFGTLVLPKRGEKLIFGLAEGVQVHPGVVSAFLLPFWDALPFRVQLIDGLTVLFGPGVRRLADRSHLLPLPVAVRATTTEMITVSEPNAAPIGALVEP